LAKPMCVLPPLYFCPSQVEDVNAYEIVLILW
jgi:hypothetical protein